MCESNVYLEEKGQEKLILENVELIKPTAEGVYLRNILGEEKTVKAKIKEIRLVDHKILLNEP